MTRRAPHDKSADGSRRKPPSKPYKAREASVTSAMMAKVRNKNSKAEVRLRRALWKTGRRYRIHDPRLPGKPDLVFSGARVVVFVDSDWWHGRILVEEGEAALRAHLRTSRSDWWVSKFQRNVERDREVTAMLQQVGWRVLRIWESEILADVDEAAGRVISALQLPN